MRVRVNLGRTLCDTLSDLVWYRFEMNFLMSEICLMLQFALFRVHFHPTFLMLLSHSVNSQIRCLETLCDWAPSPQTTCDSVVIVF